MLALLVPVVASLVHSTTTPFVRTSSMSMSRFAVRQSTIVRMSDVDDDGQARIRELEAQMAAKDAAMEEQQAENVAFRQREQAAAAEKAAAEQAAANKAAADRAAMERAAAERAAAERAAAEQAAVEQEKIKKLFLSLVIDVIGMATYAVPVVGEAGDIGWAPISAYLIYQLYGNGLISGLAFAEELLPGLDIIPTATIAWVLENTEFGQGFAQKAPTSDAAPPPNVPWEEMRKPRDDGMRRAQGSVVDDADKTS